MMPNSVKLSLIRNGYIDQIIGKEIFREVTSIPWTNNPLALVSDFFFRKATKTLDTICVLCECGFAEDALILGRTIFELSLYLKWIASPDSIEQRRLRAESFIYDGDQQRVAKLNEFKTLKQQAKCVPWILQIDAQNPNYQTIPKPQNFVPIKKLKGMAAEVGEPWECMYHFMYRSISKLVHPSGSGSRTYIQDVDQEKEVSRAISFALPMHYHLTDTTLSLFDLGKFRPPLEEFMKSFITKR